MRHQMEDCSQYAPGHAHEPIADCDECRKLYESWQGICGHCWRPVSNSAYFGKRGKSAHIDGTCAERQASIPTSWFTRKTTAPRSTRVDFTASSNAAEEMFRAWRQGAGPIPAVYLNERKAIVEQETPADPLAEKLVRALEEQNELLRQLARQAA